jgi:hypothetical protein
LPTACGTAGPSPSAAAGALSLGELEMPRYVVHVGPHKTGSTYLQSRFAQLRPYLASRGIIHPAIWNEGDEVSQFPLFRRLRAGDGGLEAEFAALNRSSYDVVLISAEDLVELTQDESGRMAELVGVQPIDIVFYCRRWSELLYSAWRELVKQGYSVLFPELLAAEIIDPFASELLNFQIRLDRLSRVFGRDCIRLVSYSHLVDHSIDLFEHFARSFLGLRDLPMPAPELINSSPDPIDTETLRILHALHWVRSGTRDPRLSTEYLQHKDLLDIGAVAAAMQSDMHSLVIDDDAFGLRSLHHELLRQYGDRLVEPRPGQLLFAPGRAELPLVGQRYLLVDGVFDAVDRIYRQLAAGFDRQGDSAALGYCSASSSPAAMSPAPATSA